MKIIINNSSMVPIYEQIMEQIKAQIISGELKENDIPLEAQLASICIMYNNLLKKGKENGFLTFEELAASLKGLDMDSESLDDLYNFLNDNNIEVVADSEIDEGGESGDGDADLLLEDIEIPKNKLVVMTGVSGSGKSSLAFDTIYAEGQRRYVESLSAYARQFLGNSNVDIFLYSSNSQNFNCSSLEIVSILSITNILLLLVFNNSLSHLGGTKSIPL